MRSAAVRRKGASNPAFDRAVNPGSDQPRAKVTAAEGGTVTGHVLIIVQNLPVPLDRRVWLECKALVAAGFRVSVICPKGPGDPEFQVLDRVRLHKYDPPPQARGVVGFAREFAWCWAKAARLMARIHAEDPVDVIQACNPPDIYFSLAAPMKLRGVRFVYDQHDLCPELYEARFPEGSPLLLGALKMLERATYLVADHVIATNESFREIARRRGRLGPDQVTVVRSGPPASWMQAVAPRPELRNGRAHLCCYLGVMGPQDGVDLLLTAIARLVHDMGRDDCHFALLGFGDCLEELQLMAKELEIESWVTFTGRADETMIRSYLSTADLAVAPDPKNGFNDLCTMNKVVEYMAFGLPIVTFDLKETQVSAGEAARYVAGNDPAGFAAAIDEMLADPDQRERMGGVARQRVWSRLSWEHQAEAYVGVYRDLLRRSSRRGAADQVKPSATPGAPETARPAAAARVDDGLRLPAAARVEEAVGDEEDQSVGSANCG